MAGGRGLGEDGRGPRRPRWGRRLVDGVLVVAAAALLVERGGPFRDAIDGWLRHRDLLERAGSRWSELTGLSPDVPADGLPAGSTILVEFTDYRCPFCRRAQPALDSLDLLPVGPGGPRPARTAALPGVERARRPPTAWRVVRHLPIATLHPDAPLLARVSVCAEKERSFPAVHRALYDAPPSASDTALFRLLTDAGAVDPEAVLRCAGTSWAADRIRTDLRLAAELRLRATPTFLARGAAHEGTLSVARLREMLRPP